MALSKSTWNKFTRGGSNVKIKDTPKIFYNKYCWKVEFTLPGGRFLEYSKSRYPTRKSFIEYIADRRKEEQSRLARWGDNSYSSIANANGEDLWEFRQMHLLNKNCVRLRTEGSTTSVFTTSEEVALKFANKFSPMLTEIMRPASPEAEEKLKNNVIFNGRKNYKHRVNIKAGRYNTDVKLQILNYLQNYEGDIYVSPGIAHNLANDSIIRGYFHCNDTGSLLFLKMISPDFVGKIFTIDSPDDK